MSVHGDMRGAARALHKQLALPVARANVWATIEEGARVLIVEIDPSLSPQLRKRIPDEFEGFRVLIRDRLNPQAHFKRSFYA